MASQPTAIAGSEIAEKPGLRHVRSSHFVVAATYLVLAAALTWPLVLHLTDHAVGVDIDEGIFVWNLWWLRHAVLDLRQNPLFTSYIFYPVGVSLVYYTLTFVNGLISLPLQPFIGPIGANNVILIGSLAGSGFSAYALCRYLLRRGALPHAGPAAFVGGALFAFAASRWVYASFGSSNLTTLWPIPLFVLALVRTMDGTTERKPGWLQPALAILWFALTFYTELTLAMFEMFLAITLVPAGLRAAWQAGRFRALVLRLSVLATGCLVVMLPLLFLMWREDRIEGQYLTDKWGYADGFSADLLSFFLPTRLHPLFGSVVAPWTNQFTDVNIVYIGYGVLALSALAIWKYRRLAAFWAWSALAYAVLSLGPVLHILGRSSWSFDGLETNVPLPYIILHYIPLISANRFPNRFSIPMTLALAVLVALGTAALLRRAPGRLAMPLAGVVLVVMMFDQIAVPLPLNDLRAPAVYDRIAAEPGDFSIAQLPLGWRNSYGVLGKERTTLQAYQYAHGKRMIGGNISRNPPFKFTYFSDLPVFGTIAALEQGTLPDAATEARDAAIAPALVRLYDLRYLVVHRKYGVAAAEAYAQKVLPLDKLEDDGDVALYRVRPTAPPASVNIAFGEESSRPYRGDGWTGEEQYAGTPIRWSTRQSARIFLPEPELKPMTISLRAAPLDYPGRVPSRLRLMLNGATIGEWPFVSGFATYAAKVDPARWHNGANALDVEVDPLVRPRDVLPFDRTIGTTGTEAPVDIRVESAGLAGGNFAHITIDGKQESRDRRGYNLVALNPSSGSVEQAESFDTFADPAASARLAETISKLPIGTIVVLAVKDDASSKLGEDAILALRSLGMTADLRGKFRQAHAAIGVKGAASGTALEATSSEVARLAIGRVADDRTLGAAVTSIEVTPQ